MIISLCGRESFLTEVKKVLDVIVIYLIQTLDLRVGNFPVETTITCFPVALGMVKLLNSPIPVASSVKKVQSLVRLFISKDQSHR